MKINTIDIAHPPRKTKAIEEELCRIIAEARVSRNRIIKLIHGRSGNTKMITRNWIFKSRRNFKDFIYGEDYNIFNPAVQKMRQECGFFNDQDLGADNSGMTIIWLM